MLVRTWRWFYRITRSAWLWRHTPMWFWARIVASIPEFNEGIRRSLEEYDRGLWYRARLASFAQGIDIPNPDWPRDDPQQPDGWFHDGRRWRLRRDGGWLKDAWGFWRYNHPGDPGWTENPDGSWRYIAAGEVVR